MAIIEFDNVSYSYRGDGKALDGVSLHIGAGEFVCVCGSNGSGKSTLAKHMSGLLVPDTGSVRAFGRDTRDESEAFAIRSRIGMVFQNPDDQLVASLVEDDVAFGPGNLGVDGKELRSRVSRVLAAVGLAGFETAATSTLSGGQKQLVAIAGALAMQPRVLVLDEAAAMLDPRGRDALMHVCRKLHDAGLTIIYITHFMEEAALAGRIIVLESGRVALDGRPRDVLANVDRLEELGLEPPYAARISEGRFLTIGELLSAIASGEEVPKALEEAQNVAAHRTSNSIDEQKPRERAITLNDVAYKYPTWALSGVTLDIFKGELFGIAGHTGSGKSTLMQLASGLLKPASGTVATGERHDIGMVFQYPERQLFAATVFDDVAFGPRNLRCDEQEVETRVSGALEAVHLKLDELRTASPFALSGGMQRRVAIAGVLAMRPTILLLDEPMAGLDPRSRKSLLELVQELRANGMTIVLVSHNMDDLARLCDRIAVLNEGRLEMIGSPAEVFADEARLKGIGLDTPQFMQLVNAYSKSYKPFAASLNS